MDREEVQSTGKFILKGHSCFQCFSMGSFQRLVWNGDNPSQKDYGLVSTNQR